VPAGERRSVAAMGERQSVRNVVRQLRDQLSGSSAVRIFIVVLVVVAIPLLIRTREPQIAPWDELYHLSYVQYVYEGSIPKPGDALNTWSREVFSCRPVYPFGVMTFVPCGEIGEPLNYPEGGTNTAGYWPPIYYGVVALLVRLQSLVMSDPFIAARQATAMIWAVGVATVAVGARRLGASLGSITLIAAVLSSLPAAYFHSAFVTPHASGPLLVGLALMLFTSSWSGRRRALGWIGMAALTALTVPHAVGGFAAVALAEALRSVSRFDWRSEGLRRGVITRLAPASMAVVTAAVISTGWSRLQGGRFSGWAAGTNPDLAQSAPADPLTLDVALGAFWRFLPHSLDWVQFSSPTALFLSSTWALILVGGLGAVLLGERSPTMKQLLPLAGALVVVSILFSIYIENYMLVPVQSRYGMTLIIVGLAITAASIRRTGAVVTTAGLSVVTYLVGFQLPMFVP
jgi:hypothetical protein